VTGVRVSIVAVEKEHVLYILSVSVALFIRHGKRMRHTILSFMAVWLYHIFQIYRKKVMIF